MPTVTTTERDAQRKSRPSINRSRTCGVLCFASRALTVWSAKGFSVRVCATELIGSEPRKIYYRFLAIPAAWAKNRRGTAPPVLIWSIPALHLGFKLHQLFDSEADLVLPSELGAEHLLVRALHVVRVGLGWQRHILYFTHQLVGVFHVELDEFLYFGPVERLGIDVNEDRTGQRLIGAIDHGLE